MQFVEELFARGHPNVLGTHRMTFEITRDAELSRRGNCVIAVNATKGPREMSIDFKKASMRQGSRITMNLEVSGLFETIRGEGSPDLNFTHQTEMVGRKSSYPSDRTIMIRADKAACDLDRRLIDALKSPNARLTVHIIAEV
ncbi:MAG: DUF371 domain-containing protein [Candidatus Bathyarchaeia archaeon]